MQPLTVYLWCLAYIIAFWLGTAVALAEVLP
jgi:hypothetical protein